MGETRDPVAILVVTHGESGAAMVAAARSMLGDAAIRRIFSLSVGTHEDGEIVRQRLEQAVEEAMTDAGVLILCDLHGATPANCLAQIKRARGGVEVVAGVSLPMLIKLTSSDRSASSLADLAQAAIDTAARSIHLVGDSS